MKLRFLDWIWRIKGKLAIEPSLSAAETYARLEGLFREKNTTYHVYGDTLTFTKTNQHPQDKMSVFDGGTLRTADGVLHYDLTSRALLACFLAPLLFLAVGYAGVSFDQWRNPPEVAKAKAEAAKRRSRIKAENVPMNPIDAFLGAPKPEKKKKDDDESGKRNRKPSMTTAYVFMGIFFGLRIFGRILEHRLVHSLFRARLVDKGACQTDDASAKGLPPLVGTAT